MKTALPLLLLILSCAAAYPAVTIGGFSYHHVDPGPEFTEKERPVQDWRPPAPTEAEAKSDAIVYVTPDPGDFKPYLIPQQEQRAQRLSAFLARGEDEPVWFGIYALDDLAGVTVKLDLKGAPLTVDVRNMFFWPQRTGWRSRQWYITPELLLPCEDGKTMVPTRDGLLEWRPLDVQANETAAFWLTLSARLDAKPGVYEAAVTISSAGKPDLALPLQIEVLPFELVRPADRSWLMYSDSSRWRNMSDEQVEAELRDFARHGMTGLVEMPLGSVDLSQLKEGKAEFDASAFIKLARQCREAGLPGPHVCHFSVEGRVCNALGVKCDLRTDEWPEEMKAGLAEVARAAVEATKDDPAKWYFYGVDEPRGDNTFAVQQYQSWHKGGAQTYATFYGLGFLEKAAQYLTAPCFGVGLVSRESRARSAFEGCAEVGAEFWWYGTGSYVNPAPQEAFMFANRYGAGYLFWKTGARAQVSWTFCRPHEDVFNDFDGSRANSAEPKEQATSYPHLLKPRDFSTYQGAIPTIAWESLREGVDDYTYLRTLEALIAQASQSDEARARAIGENARASLAALVEGIPWVNPMGVHSSAQGGLDATAMQRVRRAVADMILDLQAALAGRPAPSSVRAPANVALSVRTAAPSNAIAESLPVLCIPRASKPPTIDGSLDDRCWLDAAGRVNEFRFARSGEPVTAVKTLAAACYDDKALYVSFACAEPAMDSLVAKQRGHDQSMVWVDDSIEFFVDPTGRREHYAHFIVNTNGSVYDEINQDPSWNPDAAVAVKQRPAGWDVELAIPWAALEAAGLARSSAMVLNFYRSRFAAPQEEPHMAWSCPFGGFHTPARFGVGILQRGPVALSGVELPRFWGRQNLTLRLRNLRAEPSEVRVQANAATRELRLERWGEASVSFPLQLTEPGKREIALAWGPPGAEPQRAVLTVETPPALEMIGGTWFLGPDGAAEATVHINVAPAAAGDYRLRVRTVVGEAAMVGDLLAKPGQQERRTLQLSGEPAALEVFLVDTNGKQVSQPITGRLFALPGAR